MVLSLEGKESCLPVLRVFTVLLFNECKGFPALVVGTITSRGAQLRITSEPPDSVCWRCGLAFPTAVEMPWHLSLWFCFLCLAGCPPACRWAQMPCCSAIRTRGRVACCCCGTGHQLVALGIVGLVLRPRPGFDS